MKGQIIDVVFDLIVDVVASSLPRNMLRSYLLTPWMWRRKSVHAPQGFGVQPHLIKSLESPVALCEPHQT